MTRTRTDRTAGLIVVIFAAVVLIIGVITIANHFQGQANHRQGQTSQQILKDQADFGAWLIAATAINHNTICAVAVQRHIDCPPLPPLPKDLSSLRAKK